MRAAAGILFDDPVAHKRKAAHAQAAFLSEVINRQRDDSVIYTRQVSGFLTGHARYRLAAHTGGH